MSNSNQSFDRIASSFSDEKLKIITSNPEEYSPRLADACLKECKKRGITPNKPSNQKQVNQTILFYDIKNKVSNGSTDEECENFLLQQGLNINAAQAMIQQAKIPTAKHVISPFKNKDYYGLRTGTVILLALITLKILYRLLT